jgi:hypothetical protein
LGIFKASRTGAGDATQQETQQRKAQAGPTGKIRAKRSQKKPKKKKKKKKPEQNRTEQNNPKSTVQPKSSNEGNSTGGKTNPFLP